MPKPRCPSSSTPGSGSTRRARSHRWGPSTVRFLIEHDANVFAQAVARPDDGDRSRLSVSSNSDIVLDVLDWMRSRGGRCLLVGEVNWMAESANVH